MALLPPLLLTGGPASGKTTTARLLASMTPHCAALDVDDLRQLIIGGHLAPWEGAEGRAQHLLGVRNAAALAANLRDQGFDVIISDVVDPDLLEHYRALIGGVIVIRLAVDGSAARARAASRPRYLSDDRFEALHEQQRRPLGVDLEVAVSALSIEEQVQTVWDAWVRLAEQPA